MKKSYLDFRYFDLISKYKKFSLRLQKSIEAGKFWKLSVEKRQALLARIEKLRVRLNAMNPKLSGAMLAAGLMLTAGNAMSQANFIKQTGTNNPANAVVLSTSGYGAPIFADLDFDGDKDMIVADYYEDIQYFKNTGTKTAPIFTAQTSSTNNPFFNLISNTGEGYTVPTLGDIDGDGDLDLLTGHDGDLLQYFKNTGTKTSPIFTLQTGTNHIFPDISTVSGNSSYDELAPSFVDIDNDGDLDVLIGDEDTFGISMLKNTGSSTAPSFTFIGLTSTSNPFASANVIIGNSYNRVEPGFGDLDKDGDIDAWIGGNSNTPKYFKNTGTKTAGSFTQITGTSNPFNAVVTSGYAYAAFVDIDGDGDNDMFFAYDSEIVYYKNTDPSANPLSVRGVNIDNQVTAFPNPTKDRFNISIDDASNLNSLVVISDSKGVEVMRYQSSSNDFTLDISSLDAGMYMVVITSEEKVAVKKMVKQ